MRVRDRYELPPDRQRVLDRAVRLEWITLAYMSSVVVVLYLTLGGSQAMKAAWVEDILSLIPPIAFLISVRVRDRRPDDRFPYGYHRAVSIAFLVASVALFTLGAFILIDSLMKLARAEHPTIGTMELFGLRFWAGWAMIAALIYSVVGPMILGRAKKPLAKEIHDKTLEADAAMNRADWLTGLAGAGGVLGIGFGWWWADGVAAAVIGFDVTRDGFKHLKGVISDLMDQAPTEVDRSERSEVPERVRRALEELDWVVRAQVRLREEGHVTVGEAFVVPRDESDLVDRLAEATRRAQDADWRAYDIVVTAVRELAEEPSEAAGERRSPGGSSPIRAGRRR